MPEQFETKKSAPVGIEEGEFLDRGQEGIDRKFSDDKEKIEGEIEALAKEMALSIWQIKIMLRAERENPEGIGRPEEERKIWPRLTEINGKTDEVDREWDAETHELKEVRRMEKEEREN